MRLKQVFLFLLTVLIPTSFLAYFSLLTVRGEREALEKNRRQKHQAMAQIVMEDIKTTLKKIPKKLQADPAVIEPLLFRHTLLFQDEVMIFDRYGRAVDGVHKSGDFPTPVYRVPLDDLPYEIAVYGQHPVILGELEKANQQIAQHFQIVGLCVLAILLGGLFTLGELFHEWQKTKIKSEFLSHLVHDIRGPLTSIRMFSEMLENDRVPSEEKRKQYSQIISAESEKLMRLVHNVLDFSRIENRRRRYERKPEDLGEIVTETVRRFQSRFANGSRRVTCDITRPLSVRIDADSISQALMNLLSNAVKYSPEGSEVRVVLSREGKTANLSVIDQGIGIPKKEQKKIFREYYRGEDQEVRNREGSGLGLVVVKYAVLAHHGKVSVKSEGGKGSEFKIQLPII